MEEENWKDRVQEAKDQELSEVEDEYVCEWTLNVRYWKIVY